MPDLSRSLAPTSERPLDSVLDAAARLTAVVTVAGELAHWQGAWRPGGASWFDAIPEGERFAAHEALSRAASGGLPVEVDLSIRAIDGGRRCHARHRDRHRSRGARADRGAPA